jgi:prevent-host-death family protein
VTFLLDRHAVAEAWHARMSRPKNWTWSSTSSKASAYAYAMRVVGVHEAKTTLSRLIRDVEAGEEIVIRRGAEPIARLVPMKRRSPRALGQDAGAFAVPDDFDAQLPEDVLDDLET